MRAFVCYLLAAFVSVTVATGCESAPTDLGRASSIAPLMAPSETLWVPGKLKNSPMPIKGIPAPEEPPPPPPAAKLTPAALDGLTAAGCAAELAKLPTAAPSVAVMLGKLPQGHIAALAPDDASALAPLATACGVTPVDLAVLLANVRVCLVYDEKHATHLAVIESLENQISTRKTLMTHEGATEDQILTWKDSIATYEQKLLEFLPDIAAFGLTRGDVALVTERKAALAPLMESVVALPEPPSE